MYPTVIPVNRNDRPQDIINKILLSTRYSGITSERSDPFAEGWNAAMKFQKMRELDLCKPLPMPVNVIFSNPATIVFWSDGDKTVVKCQPGDTFCAETGLSMAMPRFLQNCSCRAVSRRTHQNGFVLHATYVEAGRY